MIVGIIIGIVFMVAVFFAFLLGYGIATEKYKGED